MHNDASVALHMVGYAVCFVIFVVYTMISYLAFKELFGFYLKNSILRKVLSFVFALILAAGLTYLIAKFFITIGTFVMYLF